MTITSYYQPVKDLTGDPKNNVDNIISGKSNFPVDIRFLEFYLGVANRTDLTTDQTGKLVHQFFSWIEDNTSSDLSISEKQNWINKFFFALSENPNFSGHPDLIEHLTPVHILNMLTSDNPQKFVTVVLDWFKNNNGWQTSKLFEQFERHSFSRDQILTLVRARLGEDAIKKYFGFYDFTDQDNINTCISHPLLPDEQIKLAVKTLISGWAKKRYTHDQKMFAYRIFHKICSSPRLDTETVFQLIQFSQKMFSLKRTSRTTKTYIEVFILTPLIENSATPKNMLDSIIGFADRQTIESLLLSEHVTWNMLGKAILNHMPYTIERMDDVWNKTRQYPSYDNNIVDVFFSDMQEQNKPQNVKTFLKYVSNPYVWEKFSSYYENRGDLFFNVTRFLDPTRRIGQTTQNLDLDKYHRFVKWASVHDDPKLRITVVDSYVDHVNLAAASEDPDPTVRIAVIKNSYTSNETFQKLLQDPNPEVVVAAKHKFMENLQKS